MLKKNYLKDVDEFFAPNNSLANFFDSYEYRPEQQKMAIKVGESLIEQRHLLVEAGTGTGKSLAYLVPSILIALQEEEKVVISTNTINLQEQLINKDIPLLQEVLDLDFKAVLVKGRKNYICIRRLIQFGKSAQLSPEEYNILSRINNWILETRTGCRSDLDFSVSYDLWDHISSESDLCLRSNCPYYDQCHFIFARDEAQEADILVSNHHLLFADIALRKERDLDGETAVLPPYKRIVFDEAHNVEDVASNYLGFRVSRKGIIKLLESLYNQEQGTGVLLQARLALKSLQGQNKQRLQQKIDNQLIPLVRKISEVGQGLFNNLISFIKQNGKQRDRKLRLIPKIREEDFWKKLLEVEFDNFILNLNKLGKGLDDLLRNFTTLEEEFDDVDSVNLELKAKVDYILTVSDNMMELASYPEDGYVYWLENYEDQCSFHAAPLNIAEELQDNLLTKMDAVVFTSATLTVENSFEFIQNNLGLTDDNVDTLEVGSPFNYQEQLQVAVAKDMPQPNNPDYTQAVIAAVKEIIQATQGRTLVLFTSYGMLNKVYYQLKEDIDSLDIDNIYRQGMKSRQYLIKDFKEKDRAVLLGTSSFWEGVDIPGEELSCVVIVKLPFVVPSEPVVEARVEEIESRGENAFFNYMLPQAVIKFKQGFGRLIRTKEDKGWVIILDQRVVSKRYGKVFLKSLPTDSRILINNLNQFARKIKKFL